MKRETQNINFHVPTQMKSDLEKLAERNDLTLSQYLRRVLHAHLRQRPGGERQTAPATS